MHLEFMRGTNNNTWGLGFSEEGYVFGSTANGCPSVHMPIPNRYYDQVAGWSPETLENIAPIARFDPLDDKIRQVDWHGGYHGRLRFGNLHRSKLSTALVEPDSNGLRSDRAPRW